MGMEGAEKVKGEKAIRAERTKMVAGRKGVGSGKGKCRGEGFGFACMVTPMMIGKGMT